MQAVITWVDPTTLSDGTTAIPAGDFAFVQVSRSIDNGQTYEAAGHAAPGQQTFTDDLDGFAPGAVLYKLESVDTQTPALVGPDSSVVSVTIPVPALAAIGAPSGVAAVLQADPTPAPAPAPAASRRL